MHPKYVFNMIHIDLKIKIAVLIAIFIILQSCRKTTPTTSHPNSSLNEAGKEVYTEALTIAVDTSVTSFENLTVLDATYKKGIQSETHSYYTENGGKTRWLFEDIPSRIFSQYIEALKCIEEDGLNPETYRRSALKKVVDSAYKYKLPNDYKAYLDKQITASFLLFAKHLTSGRFSKRAYGKHTWIKPKYKYRNIDMLLHLGDNDDLEAKLASLYPKGEQYRRMKYKYIQLKNHPLDTIRIIKFSDPKNFVYGYTDPEVESLRNALAKKGFGSVPKIDPQEVDSTLIWALKRFQRSNGLTPDGSLGIQTLNRLNMNKARQRDLLRLNMERMRVFNNDLGDDYIIVNIPDYKLFLYHKDSLIYQTKVVVGRAQSSTPIFTDSIRSIEFRPTWSVPQSIIRKEMIPQMLLQEDPERYKNRGYTMYENGKVIDPLEVDWTNPLVHKRAFYFVEAPSERNSLGLVKFLLNNNMSIYLHDTPSKYLFEREQRALSHGCVRVQNPSQLAYYLLKNEGDGKSWTEEKVKDFMNNNKRNQYRVKLNTKYMINILYYTISVDKKGEATIKNDIYDLDNEQLKDIKRFES